MFTLLALIAGTLSAAAVSESTSREAKLAQLDRLRVRLGWDRQWFREDARAAVGIPVWVYPDGDSIVRLVIPAEIQPFEDLTESGYEYVDDPSASSPVALSEENRMYGPFGFFYLDSMGRVQAVIGIDPHPSGGGPDRRWVPHLLDLKVPNQQIVSDRVRARLVDFLDRYEMWEDLSEEELGQIWSEKLLVPAGISRVHETLRAHAHDWTRKDAEAFLEDFPFEVRAYGEAFFKLAGALNLLEAEKKEYDRRIMLDSTDKDLLLELIEHDPDYIWDMLDVDPDDLSEALQSEDSEEAAEDLGVNMVDLESLKNRHDEYLKERIWYDTAREADKLRTKVDEYASSILLSHDLSIDLRDGEFTVYSDSSGGRYDPFLRGEKKIQEDWLYLPDLSTRLILGDAGVVTPEGILSLLDQSGWLESKEELLAEADEPVWVWPGPLTETPFEVDQLLGTRDFHPLLLDLPEFVAVSKTLGLALPEHTSYWKDVLELELPGL